MIKKCGWCGKFLGEKEPLNDNSETHTICKDCRDKSNKEYAECQ